MLSQATKIHAALGRVLARKDRILETERTITKVRFEILMDGKTGEIKKVRSELCDESDG